MNKIITINNEEYIKKIHYDKLEKRKTKLIKKNISFSDVAITNVLNILAIINKGQKELFEKKNNLIFKELDRKIIFKEYEKDEEYPLIIINKTKYNFKWFIQAKNIAKAFDDNENYTIHISNKINQPCLLEFNLFYIIIAPIIENE